MSCGEGEFPVRRLSQMVNALSEKLQLAHTEAVQSQSQLPPPPSATSLLSNVLIEQVENHEQLRESLESKLPDMCRTRNVKLLIIDRYV